MNDEFVCEMVAKSIDEVADKAAEALDRLAERLFPRIGVPITDETKRAFSAGIGIVRCKMMVEKKIAEATDGLPAALA